MKNYFNLFEKSLNNKFKILSTLKSKNDEGKTKYLPPFFKEWKNTLYFYNKNTNKKLPFINIIINKLIKTYINLMYTNFKVKKISTKRRNRFIKNIYISKAEIKYTNSIGIITIHTMNNLNSIFKKYEEYLNYIVIKKEEVEKWIRIFIPGKVYWNWKKKSYIKTKYRFIKKSILVKQWPFSIMKQFIRPNFIKRIQSKYSNKNINKIQFDNLNEILKFNLQTYNKNLELFYLDMIKLRLKEIREEYSNYLETIWKYNQLNIINFTKLNNNSSFILKLKKILSRILKIKLEFNIINIKYHTYNPEFFTKSLSLKLKKNKFNLIRSMTNIINRNKISIIDKSEKYVIQKKKDWSLINNRFKDLSLISVLKDINLNKLLTNIYYSNSLFKNKNYINNYNNLLKIIFNNINYKYISGIRLEIKGRLTKRYRADRSIYKLLWKGGLKNKYSSYNKLSTVMFRGNSRTNVLYSISKDKRRIGAFAVKGWISGK